MLKENIIPMIGPEIDEDNLNSPPTYFIFLAIAKLIFKTVPKTTYAFAFIGTLAAALLTATVYIENKKNLPITALAAMFFFSSFNLVGASRMAWHPYPVIFFISASLFFLSLARKTKRESHVELSVIFYILGLSTYISPIVIFPMILVETFIFFRNKYPKKKIRAFFKTVKAFLLPGLIIYSSQIFYEINNKFPILRNDHSQSKIAFHGISESFAIITGVLKSILIKINPGQFPISLQVFFILCLLIVIYLIYEGFLLKKIKKIFISPKILYILTALFLLSFFRMNAVDESYRLQPLALVIYLSFFSFTGFIVKRKLKITFFLITLLISIITINNVIPNIFDKEFDQINNSYQGQKKQVELIKKTLHKWTIKDGNYFLLGNTNNNFPTRVADYSTVFPYHFHLMNENRLFELNKTKNQFKIRSIEDLITIPYLLFILPSEHPPQYYFREEISENDFSLIDMVSLSQKLNLVVLKNSKPD